MAFQDHFSGHATSYARFRPRYPAGLFEFLAQTAPARELAWDCGTGSGQAAGALAERFRRVVASDPSHPQVAAATSHSRTAYFVGTAESAPLRAGCADLVTVAQALHWFDCEAFFREVRRVLRPGGVVAAWCYNLMRVTPAVDRVLDRYYRDVVGPYWPPERRLLEQGYRTIPFPFPALAVPNFAMEGRLALGDLFGYLGTWSATVRYRAARGTDPVDAVRADLAAAWGPGDALRGVSWPLQVRAGVNA